MAAAVVLSKYPDCETKPMTYQSPLDPKLVQGKKVLIVDFSFQGENLHILRTNAASWFIIDHHASAKHLETDSNVHLDENHCGSALTWQLLNPGVKQPPIIDHIEDYDLWKHKLVGTMDIICGLSTMSTNGPKEWVGLLSEFTYLRALERGIHIHMAVRDRRKKIKATTRHINFGGFENIPIVNCARDALVTDQLLNELSADRPFAVTWYQEADGRIRYSLRSSHLNPEHQDVSLLCQLFGGGGHKHAAGFYCSSFPEVLPLITIRDITSRSTAKEVLDVLTSWATVENATLQDEIHEAKNQQRLIIHTPE